MKIAALQMCSTTNRERNLRAAETLLARAADAGASLAVLPELFSFCGPAAGCNENAELPDGPTCTWASQAASRYRVYLVAGSYTEKLPGSSRCANTSNLYGPDGTLLASYRKIHLFDCNVPGAVYHESAYIEPGQAIACTPIDQEFILGQAICFDLRFPEHFAALRRRGGNLICLPAAFTEKTGRDHWELLLRARAAETQSYLIAADQFGAPGKALPRYGRSLIIDPWGTVLAQAPDRETLILADIDISEVQRIRRLIDLEASFPPAPPPASRT